MRGRQRGLSMVAVAMGCCVGWVLRANPRRVLLRSASAPGVVSTASKEIDTANRCLPVVFWFVISGSAIAAWEPMGPYQLGVSINTLVAIDSVLLLGTKSGIYRLKATGDDYAVTGVCESGGDVQQLLAFGSTVYANAVYWYDDTMPARHLSPDTGKTWIAPAWSLGRVWGGTDHYLFDRRAALRSSDAGQTWDTIDAGSGLAYFSGETILKTTRWSDDEGSTWHDLNDSLPQQPSKFIARNNRWFVSGVNGILISDDHGTTWNSLGFDNLSVYDFFVDDSLLFVSTVFGISRTNMVSGTTMSVGAMPKALGPLGYVAWTDKGIMLSDDRGRSWRLSQSLLAGMNTVQVCASKSTVFANLMDSLISSPLAITQWHAETMLWGPSFPRRSVRSIACNNSFIFVSTDAGVFSQQLLYPGSYWNTFVGDASLGLPSSYTFRRSDNGALDTAYGRPGPIGASESRLFWRLLPNDLIGSNDNGQTWQHLAGVFPSTSSDVDDEVFCLTNNELFRYGRTAGLAKITGLSFIALGSVPIADGDATFNPSMMIGVGSNLFIASESCSTSQVWTVRTNGTGWRDMSGGSTGIKGGVRSLIWLGDTLVAGTYGGTFATIDSGAHWSKVDADIHSSTVNSFARSGKWLFAASSTGVYRSDLPLRFSTAVSRGRGPVQHRGVPRVNITKGPNGFTFSLDAVAQGPFTVSIYNAAGCLVKNLRSEGSSNRGLTWQFTEGGSGRVAAGFYLAKISMGAEQSTARIVVGP